MLSFLDHALINVLRELDDAEMCDLMPTLERSAGPSEEVARLRERVAHLRRNVRAVAMPPEN